MRSCPCPRSVARKWIPESSSVSKRALCGPESPALRSGTKLCERFDEVKRRLEPPIFHGRTNSIHSRRRQAEEGC